VTQAAAARLCLLWLAGCLGTGCAGVAALDCPPVERPLLSLNTRTGYVLTSPDELLDWTTSYESLGGGAGRNYFLRGPDGSPMIQVFFGRSGHRGTVTEYEVEMVKVIEERGDPIHERSATRTCLDGEVVEGVAYLVDFSTYRGRVPYRLELFDVKSAHRPTFIRASSPSERPELAQQLREILARTARD
jgi:hypothetical protein